VESDLPVQVILAGCGWQEAASRGAVILPGRAPAMIVGIGSDLMDIRRIEKSLERHGARFVARIYTEVERARAERLSRPAASYAKRFAAKEACAKALGTGFRKNVYWRDLGVVNEPSGRPTMVLQGAARDHLRRMVPAGYEPIIHLTITDEYPYAQAFVIISAVPERP
jgi:holo-[acyl-carrier protein] synthase